MATMANYIVSWRLFGWGCRWGFVVDSELFLPLGSLTLVEFIGKESRIDVNMK